MLQRHTPRLDRLHFQQTGDAQTQVIQVERFQDVIGRPLFQAGDRIITAAVGGHHHDLGSGCLVFNSFKQLLPVEPRHTDIGQNKVVAVAAEFLDGLSARGSRIDQPALIAQVVDHRDTHNFFVFSHKDTRDHQLIPPSPVSCRESVRGTRRVNTAPLGSALRALNSPPMRRMRE